MGKIPGAPISDSAIRAAFMMDTPKPRFDAATAVRTAPKPKISPRKAPRATLSAYKPSLGEKIQDGIATGLSGLGVSDRYANHFAGRAIAPLNDVTPVGDAMSFADAGTQFGRGNYASAAGNAALGVIGSVPGVGDAVAGMAHAIIPAARHGAFGKWFGDSKIVDANNNPLPVYHGTKADFDTFDIAHFGSGDEGLVGKGHYFTYNPEEASRYAEVETYGNGDAPNVIPAYLSMQNPLVISAGTLPDGRKVKDIHGGGINSRGGDIIRRTAEDAGHDGIVWAKNDGGVGHAIAFRPEQIKSAIGNRTFNPKDPRITR